MTEDPCPAGRHSPLFHAEHCGGGAGTQDDGVLWPRTPHFLFSVASLTLLSWANSQGHCMWHQTLLPPQVKKSRTLHLPAERNNYSYTDFQDASYHLERHENINISHTVLEGENKKAYYISLPPSMDIWTQSFFVPKPQTISPLIHSK